jgi:hypothetical protein
MMEDHNRLFPATGSGSGLVNDAMQSRRVLVLGCVLFALGALLCVGKESRAEPPALASEPGGSATSQRPASQDPARPPIAEERAPVVQEEPVTRDPASRPDPDQESTTDPRGGQIAPRTKTAHEPTGLREHGPRMTVGPDPARPVPQRPEARPALAGRDAPERNVEPPVRPVVEQGKPAYEPPGLRDHGRGNSLPEPVGMGSARPEKADQDAPSRPVHEQPANPHAGENTGPQEGAGAPVQHSKPEIPPGKDVHPEGSPEQAVAAGPKPDKTAGNSTYKPDGPGERSRVSGYPDHTGASTSAPEGGPASMGSAGTETPGRGSPVRTLAADETGASSGAEPFQPQTGTSSHHPAEVGGEEPARVAGSSPAQATERQAVESVSNGVSVRGGDAVPYAPPGGDQSPAGAQVAPGTPFGSAKILADPLWDERGSLVDITPEILRAGPVDPHAAPRSAFFRGSITPRGPPLEVPSPFFGFVPMMGGAATGTAGSSGTGAAPLFAVIASCLIALLYQGRSRMACTFLPPRTVPQPALERPG